MESPYACNRRQRFVGRRDFLWELGGGLGGVAFAAMLNEAQAAADPKARHGLCLNLLKYIKAM